MNVDSTEYKHTKPIPELQQTHSLLQNDIINKSVIQLNNDGQLWHVDSVPRLHLMHANPLTYQSGAFSAILKSQCHFHCLFT